MYAGTRITFHAPLRVGDRLRRETELTDLQVREGGTGTLIVTTQTRRISTPRGPRHHRGRPTRVFREEVKPGAKSGIPKRDEVPADLPWRRRSPPGRSTLFRFSALTGNPHRIHYDRPYAMEVEGYPGLVVHGPFTQTCLTNFVRDNNPGRSIRTFSMRARAPLFDTAPVRSGGPADRRRLGLRGVGGDARRHHRHAGERDAGVRQAPPLSPSARRKGILEPRMIDPLRHADPAARHPLALRRQHQRPDDARAGGRLRGEGPALPAAAARLPGARLQLAQGDAAAGGGRLPRGRAGPARLRPHHRLGRRLRRRPRPFRMLNLVRDALGPGLRARLSLGRGAWSGTTSARRSRPGARCCGPTCSARWC